MSWSRTLIVLTITLALPVLGRGGEPDPKELEAKINRLEELIQLQDEKISALEAQARLGDEQSLAAARAVEIKRLIREVLQDTDFRSQLVATTLQAGYEKGFYIKSSDEKFKLKIQLYNQFRYIGANRQTDNPNIFGRQRRDDLSGFEWERARIIFSGHLFSKDLTYTYQIDGDTDGSNRQETLDLYFDYQYAPGHKIRWGQFKIPQGFQRLSSSSEQLILERSMVSGVFDLDRSIGIMAHGKINLNKDWKFRYMAGVFNGLDNKNDDVRDVDTNFAFATRAAFEFGDYGKSQTDLRKDKTPAALIGMHFAFNDDNNDTNGPPLIFEVPDNIRAGRGGIGLVDPTGTQYYQFGVDLGYKYAGLSASTEWFVRTVNGENSRSFYELATLDHGSKHYEGGYAQVGYMIPTTKLEPVARIGGIWDNDGDNVWEYSVGANYYIHGHSLKLSADVTWTPESAITSSSRNVIVNDDITLYRLQIQAAMK